MITCDSAEPRSIAQLRALGLRVTAARKGPDSVEHGLKWLQTRWEIVIDPERCPFAAREFAQYEYDRDREDRVLPRYPDHDNHTIDAGISTSYAIVYKYTVLFEFECNAVYLIFGTPFGISHFLLQTTAQLIRSPGSELENIA